MLTRTELEQIDFPNENLYDYEKIKVLRVAFDKYNLDQLMEKLEIKSEDTI